MTQKMILNPTPKGSVHLPSIFNLKNSKNKIKLTELISANSSIQIVDEINSQLEELIKLRSPNKKYNQEELFMEIETHLDGTTINDYGNWVYYPWLNKLVHILSEDEFIEVRTNRNKNKITQLEQDTLRLKRIGIIGLSVGKAIAMTLAMERICGELVLADFDVVELSNLNRIQTGIQNFGVKKTVVVAREVAEIDPYLKITCYNDGLTEENVNDFFTKNGKLDICVEVCDGLYTKVFSREKAKALNIPVIMDTNDRGMIDIERFDLEDNKPLFHGMVDHLDLSKLKLAQTNEQKLPFIDAIVDFESVSDGLKKSIPEIGKSISSWPQLASSVNLGAAITGNVCRRILLGKFTKSGRFYVDVNEIIKEN